MESQNGKWFFEAWWKVPFCWSNVAFSEVLLETVWCITLFRGKYLGEKQWELTSYNSRGCLYDGQIIGWQRFHQSVALAEDFWAEDFCVCTTVGFSMWKEGPEKTIPFYLCSSKRGQLSAAMLWRISCLVVQKLPKAGHRSQKERSCHWPKQTNKDPQQKITLPKIKIVLKDQQKQKWTRF